MRTCLKCGNISPQASEACPSCGAIYAKVEAAMRAKSTGTTTASSSKLATETSPPSQSRLKTAVVGISATAVAATLAYVGYAKFNAYQQHKSDLAYCSSVALETWFERAKPAIEQFDRTAKAAGIAPRIAIAPLILKLSEARAEFSKLPEPPPCAADFFKLIEQSMELREEAFVAFASKEGERVVASALIQADKRSQDAFSQLAYARSKAVK